MVIVVMGVSGVGKTTVGSELARQLGWPFHDADDLHAPASIARMRSGKPLEDEHRGPWLAALARLVEEYASAGRSMVLACSALSRQHRALLLGGHGIHGDVRLVHLRAHREILARRLADRPGHFFPLDLLDSQIATLQEPEQEGGVPVLSLDGARPVAELVAAIRRALDV